VSRPVWVRDPDFDVDYHLRWVGAPGSGSLASVFEMAAIAASTAFDRARPLWEFTVVEGLEHGRAAVIQKLHHAVTDGVAGVRLMGRVYDREPEREASSDDSTALPEEREPGAFGLVVEAVWRHASERPARVRRLLGDALDAALHPLRSAAGAANEALALLPELVPTLGPMSPIATRRSSRHRYHGLAVDLETLKQAGHRFDCTVNDAFVTALTGGWRRYHAIHGATCRELRVAVPVSLRRRGEGALVSGNQVAMARLAVPVEEEDPGRRMVETRKQLRRELARPNDALMRWAAIIGNRTPDALRRRIARALTRGIDFVASSVPGIPVSLYLAGTRVRGFYMFGPTGGTALNATLFSYDGRAAIALNVDPAAVPDGDLLRHCMVEGFDEVSKLAS
jgi:diacylglycerol O-acyltransferase